MKCSACGSELRPVFEDSAKDYPEQLDNALILVFEGGYGMFIDPFENHGEHRAALCHDCAHALCKANPWMTALIEPFNGHMHGSFTEHGHD